MINKIIQYFLDSIPFMVEFILLTITVLIIAYIVLVVDFKTNKKLCKYLRKQVKKLKE